MIVVNDYVDSGAIEAAEKDISSGEKNIKEKDGDARNKKDVSENISLETENKNIIEIKKSADAQKTGAQKNKEKTDVVVSSLEIIKEKNIVEVKKENKEKEGQERESQEREINLTKNIEYKNNNTPRKEKHIHVVVKGDTLWHIAKKYVNNPWRYPELARLSHIKNPDLIYPGNKVIIILNYRRVENNR